MLPYGDAIPAGVVVHRGGTVVYANGRFCEIMGRPPAQVVGRPFYELLTPDEVGRVMDRHVRRARGEPVPDEYEVSIVRGDDGERRVIEITVNVSVEDVVVLVRDVTDVADRRVRRLALSHLGVALSACRTEIDVMGALRTGVAALGLSAAWMVPDGDDRVRVEYADLPDGGAAFARAVGRPVSGWVGPWTTWLRRAWISGGAYIDDAVAEVARFIGQPWEAAVLGIAASNRMTRGVNVRIDVGGEPTAILLLRGAWLREDDLAVAHLLGAQISGALNNARFIADAQRRVGELEALHDLARSVLRDTATGPQTLLRAAAASTRRALDADTATVMLLSDDGRAFDTLTDALGVDAPPTPLEVEHAPLLREALAADGCVVVDDLRTDRRVSRLRRALGVSGAALLVKLQSTRGLRGVLLVRRTTGRRFTDADQAMMRALVSVTEVGLSNAELYAEAQLRLADLRDAQARLIERERLAALGELSAVVAHEVRNPLAVIFNAVSALRRLVPREGDAGRMIDTVREEAERLNRIVGDLLGFARPVTPHMQPEALGPLVDSALAAALATASAEAASAIVPSVEVPDALPHARIDARLMRQALLNVILNAIDAMPSGGRLGIRVEHDAPNERLRFSVSDTGPGIPDEVRAHMFEPFFTTRAAGTGLGLAVVKRIVEAHGGEVVVASPSGVGTTFTLVVPAAT